jgi:Asp-tRNA(Asn)/Glu-tRNA(Gln) amidotransferase A subunit family amidase
MRPDEYIALDATSLAALVHRGEVTPAARDAAHTVDRTAPLAGVPFLAKDMNIEVAGLSASSRGSRDWRSYAGGSCPAFVPEDLPAGSAEGAAAAHACAFRSRLRACRMASV